MTRSRSSLAKPRASLSGVQNLGGFSSRPPARAPRTNRIWRACARPFPRQSMDMALAFCPPTEPFRAARRRAGPCGGHIAHGQALEGSVARYRSCHSVLIANVGSIRRVCHSNHVLNQTAARPTVVLNCTQNFLRARMKESHFFIRFAPQNAYPGRTQN